MCSRAGAFYNLMILFYLALLAIFFEVPFLAVWFVLCLISIYNALKRKPSTFLILQILLGIQNSELSERSYSDFIDIS